MLELFVVLITGNVMVLMQDVPDFTYIPASFLHFSGLEEIKAYIRNSSHPLANNIVETFENDCLYMEDPGPDKGWRKPFIIVEGNHRSVRELIGIQLAKKLKGRYLNNLAPCLYDYFGKLPAGSAFRRAFYLLSVYASVFNAKIHLDLNRAVVLNGGWWEQVSFSLLQALKGAPIPPPTHKIFQYPTDLFQPDLLVYVDQAVTTETLLKQKQSLVQFYQKLSNRYTITIQPVTKFADGIVDSLYLNIRENLSEHRNIRHENLSEHPGKPL